MPPNRSSSCLKRSSTTVGSAMSPMAAKASPPASAISSVSYTHLSPMRANMRKRNCRRLVIPLQAQLQELLRESRWPAVHPQPQCGWPRRSGQRPPAPRFPLYPVPPQPMQRSHGLVAELLPLVAQAWPVAVRSLRWRDLWAGPSRVRRCSRPSLSLIHIFTAGNSRMTGWS